MKIEQLQKEWKEVKLGEICEILTGFAFKSSLFNEEGKGKPLIRIRDLLEGKSKTYYSEEFEEKYLVKKGDFLIGMDGEFKIFEWKSEDALLNQRVCKLILNNDLVSPKYIFYMISRKLKEIEDKTPFVTVKHISNKQIESIAIPLPPLPTQKRIVSILEKAEALKQKRDEADLLTKEYLQSVFYEMFLNKNFSLEKLKKLTIKIENKNPINEFPEDYFNYIDISSVNNDTKRIVSTSKLLGKEAPSRARQQVKTKDIILSTVRPNLNAVALIPRELNNQICSTGFCVLQLDKDRVTAEYVFMNLTGNKFIGSMTKIAKGSSYPGISNSDILDFQIPLPPLPLQQKFANIVEHVEGLKEKQKKSKDELNLLFDALMQKAFNGE